MKLATLSLIASSVVPSLAAEYEAGQGPDWATYTKNLPKTTVTVTRYLGTETYLEGPAYYTNTIVVSAEGKALYTEIITGHNNHIDGTDHLQTKAAQYQAGEGPDWVTYTKNLPDTTVTVTRYEGTSTFLEGPEYHTATFVISSDGKPLYTEIITGHNNKLDPHPTEAPAAEQKEESTPVEQEKEHEDTESKTTTTTTSTENKEASASASTSGAAKFGYFLGAVAVGAGAYFYFRRPKNFVLLPHQEV